MHTPQKKTGNTLIFGNLGYVGSVLGRLLKDVQPECKLWGLDTGYFSGCLINPEESYDHKFDYQIRADVRSADLRNLPQFDSVIYLAALSNDPIGREYEHQTYQINHNSAIIAADFFKKNGARSFVFASSCSVYGDGGDVAKDESSRLNPLTAYAKSKLMAEQGLESIADENFSISCLRFATACGASPRMRLDLVLNDFVASALLKKEIEILSDGTPWRPLIDVRDMGKAIIWAKDRPSLGRENFLSVNVGYDDWNYRIKDLALAVAKVFKGTTIRINSNAVPDKRSYLVNFSLYKSLCPEYQTPVTLEESIMSMADNLLSANFSNSDYRNSQLVRLKTLARLRKSNLLDGSLFWTC